MRKLIAITTRAKILDEKGKIPRLNQTLSADAISTVAAVPWHTSTVLAYIESCTGLAEGGKTGVTAVVISVWFFLALLSIVFFSCNSIGRCISDTYNRRDIYALSDASIKL